MNDEQLSEKDIRYENMFLSILQNEEKIEPFLDSVFKFLYRRTDFFLLQEHPQQSFGFPKGIAKEITNKIFDKYDQLSKIKIKNKIISENQSTMKPPQTKNGDSKVEETFKNNENDNISKKELNNVENDLKKKQEYYQNFSESYNGAIRDKYSWSQSIKDIDVKIKVGQNICKSKDVKVKIEKQFLNVQAKNESNNTWDNILEDKLSWKIKPEESTWSLFPGDHIHINLEKIEERWWENLLENEEKLDVKNMNPEKPIHDLEPEAQSKIQQLMYDQHRKQLGLPTSEEEKYQDLLKKAWNAEGSPFAGTEYNPSNISFEDGNVTIKQ